MTVLFFLKKLIKASIMALTLQAQNLLAQSDELQATIHNRVEKYDFSAPKGEQWEAEKKVFSKYTPDQLAHALVVEIDLDRGKQGENQLRDIGARTLFQALDLPASPICQELDQSESPQRKTSLMFILRGEKEPIVTKTLLRQLKDHRPAVEPEPMQEWHPHALRVCDVACNVLAENLSGKLGHSVIPMVYSNPHRDEIIQKTLTEYKLHVPE